MNLPDPERSHVPWSNSAYAPQLLGPCPATPEARLPRAHAPQREAPTMRSVCTATKERLLTATGTQCNPKINKQIIKKNPSYSIPMMEVLGGSGVHRSQARIWNMSHAYIDKAGE